MLFGSATCEVRRRLWYYSTATLAAQLPFFVWLLVYFLFTCMILICFLSDSCLLRSHPIPQEIHYLTVHFTPTHLVPFQRNYGTSIQLTNLYPTRTPRHSPGYLSPSTLLVPSSRTPSYVSLLPTLHYPSPILVYHIQ